MTDDARICYGPILTRPNDARLAFCYTERWAVMTKERAIVTCPQCLALLVPRACAVCHLEHGREVEHAT